MAEPRNTIEAPKTIVQSTQNVQPGMESAETEIDLIELFFRLLDHIWLIILASILGTVIAGVYTNYFITPMYRATSKLYVVNSSDSAITLSDIQLGSTLSSDYMEVFSNWHVHELVKQRLGLDYSYKKLGDMVAVSSKSGTRVLTISAVSPDPYEAQLLANTYADVAREFIAVKMDCREPNIFEEALLPGAPYAPNKTRNLMMGFLIGFALSCGIIVLLFLLDDRIRSAKDLEKAVGVPVLGMMPDVGSDISTANHKKTKKGEASEK